MEDIARAAATAALSEKHGMNNIAMLQRDNVNQDKSSSSGSTSGGSTGTGTGSGSFFLNKERDHPRLFKDLGKSSREGGTTTTTTTTSTNKANLKTKEDERQVPLFSPSRWLFQKNSHENAPTKKMKRRDKRDKQQGKKEKEEEQAQALLHTKRSSFLIRIIHRLIDPALLELSSARIVLNLSGSNGGTTTTSTTTTTTSSTGATPMSSRTISETLTHLADKVLTSTPRLLSLANLLLSVTYLLHSAVVALFLGETTTANTTNTRREGPGVDNVNAADTGGPIFEIGGVGASTSNRIHRSGRERLGGYLLFKLLLISAVVDPDTLDLLILLSWYTLLSFLRSLAYLAGVTTAHASAAGQAPRRGVLQLLLVVLCCDLTAAGVCAALFHGAGWGMVLLLSCDCALLALDILTHVARFGQQVIDEAHQVQLTEMEASQIQLHETWRDYNRQHDEHAFIEEESSLEGVQEEDSHEGDQGDLDRASRQMDHDMELLEAIHTRRLSLMDYTAFLFELFGLVLTTVHFVHIWSLHGVNFTLVDGVLALHLHSAIAATGKKISERRNHNRIVRDLDSYFENAGELELSKACAAGDVCCICLGTMSMGNVKKVGCGHLFHTHCLREVVERARSIEAAKCPLCRASLIDGKHATSHNMQPNAGSPLPFLFGQTNNDVGRNTTGREEEVAQGERGPGETEDNNTNRVPRVPNNQDERALFRFSTEGFLPAWLPIPAFSFEVVRRTPIVDDVNRTDQPQQQEAVQQVNVPDQNNAIPVESQGEPSFLRRLLILVGAISMSPEEEAIIIGQLVDMFPQYDRSDLLRALRQHGSSEAVAESILNGSFSGAAREGSLPDVAEPRRVEQDGTWDPMDLY